MDDSALSLLTASGLVTASSATSCSARGPSARSSRARTPISERPSPISTRALSRRSARDPSQPTRMRLCPRCQDGSDKDRTMPPGQSFAGDVEARAPSTTRQGDSQEVNRAIELRRERNRIHQARHKMRQRQLVTDLEDSIVQLREEIQELKHQRELIGRGVPTTSNLWAWRWSFSGFSDMV